MVQRLEKQGQVFERDQTQNCRGHLANKEHHNETDEHQSHVVPEMVRAKVEPRTLTGHREFWIVVQARLTGFIGITFDALVFSLIQLARSLDEIEAILIRACDRFHLYATILASVADRSVAHLAMAFSGSDDLID